MKNLPFIKFLDEESPAQSRIRASVNITKYIYFIYFIYVFLSTSIFQCLIKGSVNFMKFYEDVLFLF